MALISGEQQADKIMDFAWANPEANAAAALAQISALARQFPGDSAVADAGAMIARLAGSVALSPRNITDQVTTREAQP